MLPPTSADTTAGRPVGELRTNVVLDGDLVAEAKQLSGLSTRRAVIHEALRAYVRLMKQREGLQLFGKLPWDDDLESIRRGRPFTVEG